MLKRIFWYVLGYGLIICSHLVLLVLAAHCVSKRELGYALLPILAESWAIWFTARWWRDRVAAKRSLQGRSVDR
jgi:hypothetical protein